MKMHTTAKGLIDALGGPCAVSVITGRAVSTVGNWSADDEIPPQHFFSLNRAAKSARVLFDEGIFSREAAA